MLKHVRKHLSLLVFSCWAFILCRYSLQSQTSDDVHDFSCCWHILKCRLMDSPCEFSTHYFYIAAEMIYIPTWHHTLLGSCCLFLWQKHSHVQVQRCTAQTRVHSLFCSSRLSWDSGKPRWVICIRFHRDKVVFVLVCKIINGRWNQITHLCVLRTSCQKSKF